MVANGSARKVAYGRPFLSMDEKHVFTITSYFTHRENALSAILARVTQKILLSLAEAPKNAPDKFYAVAWSCTGLHDHVFQMNFFVNASKRGQFGDRKFLYYKGFPGMSTPVFTVSVCTIVKK